MPTLTAPGNFSTHFTQFFSNGGQKEIITCRWGDSCCIWSARLVLCCWLQKFAWTLKTWGWMVGKGVGSEVKKVKTGKRFHFLLKFGRGEVDWWVFWCVFKYFVERYWCNLRNTVYSKVILISWYIFIKVRNILSCRFKFRDWI